MQSKDCFTLWGAEEPGELETDEAGPVGLTESVSWAELLGGVGWVTVVVAAGAFAELSPTAVGTAKKRSEIIVGCRRSPCVAGIAIDGGGGCRNTSGKSPRSSRKVVNPHTWPVSAKLTKIGGGEREPTRGGRGGTVGAGHQPGRSVQLARPYEVHVTILNRGETCRPTAVMFRGRLWQARQEVGVAVRASLAVLEYVVERGEELEPSLDSGVVVPHFAHAF